MGILQSRILEWAGSHSLLQGIFPAQASNEGLLHCRQIIYHLSHQGSPFILRATSNKTSSIKPVVEVLAIHHHAQRSADTSTLALDQACASASPAATPGGWQSHPAPAGSSGPSTQGPVSQFPHRGTACFPPLIWAYSQLPGVSSPLTTWVVPAAAWALGQNGPTSQGHGPPSGEELAGWDWGRPGVWEEGSRTARGWHASHQPRSGPEKTQASRPSQPHMQASTFYGGQMAACERRSLQHSCHSRFSRTVEGSTTLWSSTMRSRRGEGPSSPRDTDAVEFFPDPFLPTDHSSPPRCTFAG